MSFSVLGFLVVAGWTFHFRPRAHFQNGGRQGRSEEQKEVNGCSLP